MPSKTNSDRAARGARTHTGRRGGLGVYRPRGLVGVPAAPPSRLSGLKSIARSAASFSRARFMAIRDGSSSRGAPPRSTARAGRGTRTPPRPTRSRVPPGKRRAVSTLDDALLPDGFLLSQWTTTSAGAVRGDVEERVPAETREQPDTPGTRW